jgi:hypothetical protein
MLGSCRELPSGDAACDAGDAFGVSGMVLSMGFGLVYSGRETERSTRWQPPGPLLDPTSPPTTAPTVPIGGVVAELRNVLGAKGGRLPRRSDRARAVREWAEGIRTHAHLCPNGCVWRTTTERVEDLLVTNRRLHVEDAVDDRHGVRGREMEGQEAPAQPRRGPAAVSADACTRTSGGKWFCLAVSVTVLKTVL